VIWCVFVCGQLGAPAVAPLVSVSVRLRLLLSSAVSHCVFGAVEGGGCIESLNDVLFDC